MNLLIKIFFRMGTGGARTRARWKPFPVAFAATEVRPGKGKYYSLKTMRPPLWALTVRAADPSKEAESSMAKKNKTCRSKRRRRKCISERISVRFGVEKCHLINICKYVGSERFMHSQNYLHTSRNVLEGASTKDLKYLTFNIFFFIFYRYKIKIIASWLK